MALPSRQRLLSSPFLSLVILPFLVFLLGFSEPASAAGSAVIGVDVGTEYLKAALVKPGIPLEIVLSKDSKRKESAAIAFKPTREGNAPFPERFYGGNALALAARYPDDVYMNLKTLLGVPFNDGNEEAVKSYWSRYPALKLEGAPDGRGSVAMRSNRLGEAQKKEAFLIEEILAMQLKEVKANADLLAGAGSNIRDVVITYPAFFTAEEKRSLALAAELAGLNIDAFVSDGLAVGLNYATSRKFPSVSDGEKPEHHIVFDMGAGSTTASVLRFQSRRIKDGRFNKTVQEVHVVGAGWDKTLGGDALNDLIVDDMVAKLVEEKKLKDKVTPEQVKAHGKTMSKLWKDAEKVRQILSANSDTTTSFEGLYDDELNFKYKITRAAFEKMAAGHAARVGAPLDQALSAAGLKFDEIDSVVLHGGAIRTPFVQKELEKVVGSSKKLRTNVNADEAAVFGAAFKGAALSPSFRVKDIRAHDAATYPVSLKWASEGKDRNQKLFTATSQVGPEKQVTVKNLEDFEFSFSQLLGQDGEELPVLSVQTQNLTASVAKLKESFGCSAANITTKFGIRLSPVNGLPEVTSGNVSCEVEAGKEGGVVEGVKGFFGLGSKKGEQQPLGEDGEPSESITLEPESESSSTTASTSETSTSATTTGTPKESAKVSSQPKLEIIPISLKSTPLGTKALSTSERSRINSRLAAFDTSDRNRVLREEALNELEAFIYRSRDLADNEDFGKAIKADQLTSLQEKVAKASDWLYEESDNAVTADFQSRLKELKAIVNPALKRMKETSTRPARVEIMKEMLKNAEYMKQLIEGQIQTDEQTYSSALSASSSTATAEESETSSSAAATETPPKDKDPLDDLDDDPYSTSSSASASASSKTKTSAAAKPTGPKYTLFTPSDLAALSQAYESTKPWLDTQLELQEKLTESDDPALTVTEIDTRLRDFERILNRLYERMTAATKRGSAGGKKGSKKDKEKQPEADKGKGKGKNKAKEEKTEKATDDTRKDEL